MNDKVKIPAKVAEAIEYILNNDITIVSQSIALTDWTHLESNFPKQWKTLEEYCEANPIEYMTALVNGYEIEPDWTDQERHSLDYLKSVANSVMTSEHKDSKFIGYKVALRHFNITDKNSEFMKEVDRLHTSAFKK